MSKKTNLKVELFFESILGVVGGLLGIALCCLAIYVNLVLKDNISIQVFLLIILSNIALAIGVQEKDAKTISIAILLQVLLGGFLTFADPIEKGIKISFILTGALIATIVGFLIR